MKKPVLLLMQGIPGSGKSFIAHQIAGLIQATVASADDCPGLYRPDGSFNSGLLAKAHTLCLRKTARCLARQESVIVDNTNLNAQEISPYVVLGVELGYDVQLVRVYCGQKAAFARQKHGVPEETHKEMFRVFQGFKCPEYWPPIKVISSEKWLAAHRAKLHAKIRSVM